MTRTYEDASVGRRSRLSPEGQRQLEAFEKAADGVVLTPEERAFIRWHAGFYRWSFCFGIQLERVPAGECGWWVLRCGPFYLIRDDVK